MKSLFFFLKTFPAWIVLTSLLVVFVLFYYSTNDLAYKEWASLVLASLFTALGVQRFRLQTGDSDNQFSTDFSNLTESEIETAVNINK